MGAAQGGVEGLDFSRWLATQKAYQKSAYGLDWDVIGAEPELLTQYVTTMLNAAFLEVAEAQQEVPWKPWSTADRGEVWKRNRGKFVGEVVDVLFFLANALGAVGVTDAELAERYTAKMDVNRRRQADGYTGFENKCEKCGRALDEPGRKSFIAYRGETYCSVECARASDPDEQMVATRDGFVDARDGAPYTEVMVPR